MVTINRCKILVVLQILKIKECQKMGFIVTVVHRRYGEAGGVCSVIHCSAFILTPSNLHNYYGNYIQYYLSLQMCQH